jgi:glycerol-3-phosphate dehydrogenase
VTSPCRIPLAVLPGGAEADLSACGNGCGIAMLDEAVAARLVRLYGSELFDVLGEQPRALSPSVFAEEVAWAVEVEGARGLEDVVYRRLRAAWFLPAELRGADSRGRHGAGRTAGLGRTQTRRRDGSHTGAAADELAFRTAPGERAAAVSPRPAAPAESARG